MRTLESVYVRCNDQLGRKDEVRYLQPAIPINDEV